MLGSPSTSPHCQVRHLFGASVPLGMGAVRAQCGPRQEAPSGAARPAHGWRLLSSPAQISESLLRITPVVLNFLLSIHHWYLTFKHFFLNTFSTYQLKWLCASLTYTVKLERLSLAPGGGTERLLSPAQRFCFGKTDSAGEYGFSCRAPAVRQPQPAALPSLRRAHTAGRPRSAGPLTRGSGPRLRGAAAAGRGRTPGGTRAEAPPHQGS